MIRIINNIKVPELIVCFVVFIIIGIPNFFVTYKAEGFERVSGFDINGILRISLFFLVFFCNLILILRIQRISVTAFKNWRLPFIFYFLFFILFFFSPQLESSQIIYRLCEWFNFFIFMSFISMIWNDIMTLGFLLKIVKYISYYLLGIILVSVIFFPSKIIAVSPTTGLFRLGGSIIGPNILGLLSGISIAYFFFFDKKKYFIIPLFFIILLLTYSRGALFGLFLSFCPMLIYKNKHDLIFKFILVFLTGIIIINFYDFLEFLSRGQGLAAFWTLSERTVVFEGAFYLIKENFWFGTGFKSGSMLLTNVFEKILKIKHWSAHHAHNDIIQAYLTGGILMGTLLISIYLKTFLRIIKLSNSDFKFFILSMYIQLFLSSMTTVNLSWYFSASAGLTWFLIVLMKYIDQKNIRERNC